MTKIKKKLIITFSIVGIVLVLTALFLVLFSIKKVNVEFLSDQVNTRDYEVESIKSHSKIKKGRNIVFFDTEKSLNSLEKEFPYASFQIVRTFPSTLTVYVYERTPAFKVLNEEGYFEVYDEDLKCLEIVASENLEEQGLGNVPTLNGSNIKLCGEEGCFVSDKKLKSKIGEIIDGVFASEKTQISVMSDITFGFNETLGVSEITLTLSPKESGKENSGTIYIQGITFVKEKIFFAMTVYNQISDKETYRPKLDKLTIKAIQTFNPNNPETRYIVAEIDGEAINLD